MNLEDKKDGVVIHDSIGRERRQKMKNQNEKLTLTEQVFEYLKDNPKATNTELATDLQSNSAMIRNLVSRLKCNGYIDTRVIDGERVVEILAPYESKKNKAGAVSEKSRYRREMIDVYFDVMRSKCESIDDFVRVGRELRLLIDSL